MRGSYKPHHWHAEQANDLSARLTAAGLPHAVEWIGEQQAVFRHEERKFLIHGSRRVMVLDEVLPERLRGLLLDALPPAGALPYPAYGLATVCVLIYAVLQLLVIVANLEDMPGLVAVLGLAYVGLIAGLLWGFNIATTRPTGSGLGPLLLAVPGFILTSPGALLLLPLVLNLQLESLHTKLQGRRAEAMRHDLLHEAPEAS